MAFADLRYAGRADKAALVESGTVQRFSDTLTRILDGLPPPLVVDSSKPDPVLPHILMVHLAWAWTVILLYQPFSQVFREGAHGPYQNIGMLAMTVSYVLTALKPAMPPGGPKDRAARHAVE